MNKKEKHGNTRIVCTEEVYAEYVKKDITDDFIFGKVMQKEDNCIELLECLTGNKIESIRTIVSQKAVKVTSDSKGVRYDIYVEDDKNRIYDAEMQRLTNTHVNKNISKRSRFYQGMMDLNVLEKGQDYNDLKQSYVIFICTYDPFGKGLCCYEFENVCKDDNKIILGDERKILIFNTKGTTINVNKQVKDLLYYMETKHACNKFTERLDNDVEEARKNREWMVEYMKTLVHDMEVKNEGIALGISQGISLGQEIKLITLIRKKHNKGKDVETIADELEENVEKVKIICDIIDECGESMSDEEIYHRLDTKPN